MHIISTKVLRDFARRHPNARAPMSNWVKTIKEAKPGTAEEAADLFSKAKIVTKDRVRFDIGGGTYRLLVALNYAQQVCYVKFIGTHSEYDKIDAKTYKQPSLRGG